MVSKMKWQAADPADAIKVLGDAGYDGIEWILHYHFNSTSQLKQVVDATRKNHLQVSNIMCWEDLVTSDGKARSKLVETLKQVYFRSPPNVNSNHEYLYRANDLGLELSENRRRYL